MKMSASTFKMLRQEGRHLYEIRRKMAQLREDEEACRKKIVEAIGETTITIDTADGRKVMQMVTEETTILKGNQTIADKIGMTNFLNLAKISINDLKKFCEAEGFKFKWFVKKKGEGSTRILFV